MGEEYRFACAGGPAIDPAGLEQFKDRAARTSQQMPDYDFALDSDGSIIFLANNWNDRTKIAFANLMLRLLERHEPISVSEL